MKISYQWLTDYTNLDRPVEEIEEALTLIGFEVEGIETVGLPPLEKVVVGEVLSREQHPNADRLSVCSVKTGEGGDPVGIVCGATNFQIGDRVPVALPGSVLPGGFKIKKSKLRGVASAGMMCSAKELNLGDDHSGLLILDGRPAVGTPINEVLPAGDTVFDIEVTPNRPDCLSVIGIARELAAWFREDLAYPEVRHDVSGADGGGHPLEAVEVRDTSACPRYAAWGIRGVSVGESPEWMRRKLTAAGLRPVNNVVDCTNYVLLETGQPLHAFDAAKIRGGRLIVRPARADETIRTLDEKERRLSTGDLVIADAEGPLVIAGVMGSLDAEVDDSTTDLVLEVASFEATGIRATSRRLGLGTDSSHRFERGVDPTGIEYAAARCIDLILETSGGSVAGAPLVEGHIPGTITEIQVSPRQIVDRIGFEVSDDEIAEAWERLELTVFRTDDPLEPWTVRVPSFRADLWRVADLTEEFLRMYGTHRIPEAGVGCETVSGLPESPVDTVSGAFRSHLVANGFNEAFNYSLVPGDEVEFWQGSAAADSLALENPLARDQSHLRPSLIGGLLDVVRYNRGRARKEFRFFECGRVFREEDGHVTELLSVAFVAAPSPEKTEWLAREPFDFHRARRLVEDLAELAGLDWRADRIRATGHSPAWTDRRAAVIENGSGWRAEWGALSRACLESHGIDDPVFAAELIVDPAKLTAPSIRRNVFSAPSAFPRSVKDIAVVAAKDLLAETVRARIADHARRGVADFAGEPVRIFDVYEGQGLPDGTKSIAVTVEYGSNERTLTDKEVGAAFEDLQERIRADEDLSMR